MRHNHIAEKSPQQRRPHSQRHHHLGRELRVRDAPDYIDRVKAAYSGQPRVYNRCIDILKQWKQKKLSTLGLMHRIRSLFRKNRQLLLGFKLFLPEGYGFDVLSDDGVPVIQVPR